jgi:cation-transporting P-type ATPase 13A2
VVAFSLGSEHKKPFYTNIYFTFFLVAITALSIFSLFSTNTEFHVFFETESIAYDANGSPVSVMPYWWRWIIAAIVVLNTAINILFEKYVVQWMV